MLEERIRVDEECMLEAQELLDDAGIDYDFDSSDRIMCREEDVHEILELFDENGIDADWI